MMGAEYSVWSIDIDAVRDSLPYMKITVLACYRMQSPCKKYIPLLLPFQV